MKKQVPRTNGRGTGAGVSRLWSVVGQFYMDKKQILIQVPVEELVLTL
jgi:hypothetical protein